MLARKILNKRKLPQPALANWNNVSMLLHGEGPVDSSIITDSRGRCSLTARSNVDIKSSAKKFGNTSIHFLGTSTSLIDIVNNTYLQMASSNFTIEGWFYVIDIPSDINARLISICATSNGYGIVCQIQANQQLIFNLSTTGTSWTSTIGTAAGVCPLNTWVHLAFVRNNATALIFKDGYLVGSGAITGSINPGTVHRIGLEASSSISGVRPYHGFMDEVRITKGQALYTESFQIPTTAFPNG